MLLLLSYPSSAVNNLYLNTSNVSAGGTRYWGLSGTAGAAENSTTIVSHARTVADFYLRPGLSTSTTGTINTASIGYGWATAQNYTGTINAGTWSFAIRTLDSSTTGVAYIGVSIFKRCGTTDTYLFHVVGTTDVFAAATQQTINSSQGEFVLGRNCQIKAEYWLEVSTRGASGSTNRFYSNLARNNLTFPETYSHVYNITMNYPGADIVVNNGSYFSINCTAATDDSRSGINISFEYNTSSTAWEKIPASSSNLSVSVNLIENISNNTMYNVTVFANSTGLGVYNVRCIASSPTNSSISAVHQITVNAPPYITSLLVDDEIPSPENEIDLVAGASRFVKCNGTASDPDGFSDIDNVAAVLYASGNGTTPSSPADNSTLYINSSCSLSAGYAAISRDFNCSFDILYHAQNGTWTCNATVNDTKSSAVSAAADSNVNTLVAINVSSLELSYGNLVPGSSSASSVAYYITNFGNTRIDILLNGTNMSCSIAGRIPETAQRYNITGTDQAYAQMRALSFSQFLASDFDLNKKITADSIRTTYWRIQIPTGIKGKCTGNTSISAQQG
jgi:hypothetical protein